MLLRLHAHWAAQSDAPAVAPVEPGIRRPGDSWREALAALPPEVSQGPLSLSFVASVAPVPPASPTARSSGTRVRDASWVLPLLGRLLLLGGLLVLFSLRG